MAPAIGPAAACSRSRGKKRASRSCPGSRSPAGGLGLAVGLADRPHGEKVIVVEGDGSLLMGFSALATVGHLKPRNLVLCVLDNGVYLATGGQPLTIRAEG